MLMRADDPPAPEKTFGLRIVREMQRFVRRLKGDRKRKRRPSRRIMKLASHDLLMQGKKVPALLACLRARDWSDLRSFDAPTFHALLVTGFVHHALRLYKSRPQSACFREHFGPVALGPRQSLCKAPAGSHVMLFSEGGPGDELRFASIYSEIESRFPGVEITCDPRLESLLARSFPKIEFHPVRRFRSREDFGDQTATRTETPRMLSYFANDPLCAYAKGFDVTAPVLEVISDFRVFRRNFSRGSRQYLVPDQALKSHWRDIVHDPKGRPNIAVCWSSVLRNARRNHHYLSLSDLAPLGHLDANIWLFQHDISDEDRAEAERLFDSPRVPDLDLWNDFEGMAAFLSVMDGVAAPMTTTGELAGALGVPTYLLANCPTTAWRKQRDGSDVWHSSARIIHGNPIGDRGALATALVQELDQRHGQGLV